MEISSQAVRGIIITNDRKVILMYRKKDGKEYYTIPGSHIEKEDKTIENALKREIKEEIGIEINIIKPIFETCVENWKKPGTYKKDLYYQCEYASGTIGSGTAEEFSNASKGTYKVELYPLQKAIQLNIIPKEALDYIKSQI